MSKMLDTKKLLYILPDVAYLAEGLPAKKPHTFSIHSFTQINGDFLNEDKLIPENIQKLFGKLETGETYHIILPDFLFTSTIVSIKEKSDAQIKEELETNTFPKIGITRETHLIDSAVLNEVRGTARVQLSAIEKDLLAPIRVATQDHAVTITGISPLSWAIKSLISLEPSISVLQMGGHLYACEHYIGIDQASFAPLDDVVSIAETIKTLKGSEPSIQTVYLLSNPLIEEKLKEALNKTLPIQQMAGAADDEERMPASVKEVIEFSFRTLSISDYPVPIFPLTKASAEEVAEFGAVAVSKVEAKVDADEDNDLADAVLPKPATPIVLPAPKESNVETQKENTPEKAADIEKKEDLKADLDETTAPLTDTKKEGEETKPETTDAEKMSEKTAAAGILPAVIPAAATLVVAPNATASAIPTPTAKELENPAEPALAESLTATPPAASENKPEKIEEKSDEPDKEKPIKPEFILPFRESKSVAETTVTPPKADPDIDLRQFGGAQSKVEPLKVIEELPKTPASLPTIKNKSGVQNMLKMIFITLAVFCVTVAVGVGVGLAILKYSGSESGEETPTVAVESTPTPTPVTTATPEPTPVASASATVAPTNLKVLVVNATTKAGYAGTFKTKIEQSKLGKVTATNAKGKYDGGFVVYMKKQDDAVIAKLEAVTSLKTTFDEAAKAEDPQGTYDLVLVLAE